jgi:4-hydroxy-tetrahydrodipicolinate synthase
MKLLIESALEGDYDTARKIHHRLLPVIKALMTVASNPIPIKSVISQLGFPAGPFRLPLAPLADGEVDRLMAVIKEAGELISFSPVSVR